MISCKILLSSTKQKQTKIFFKVISRYTKKYNVQKFNGNFLETEKNRYIVHRYVILVYTRLMYTQYRKENNF